MTRFPSPCLLPLSSQCMDLDIKTCILATPNKQESPVQCLLHVRVHHLPRLRLQSSSVIDSSEFIARLARLPTPIYRSSGYVFGLSLEFPCRTCQILRIHLVLALEYLLRSSSPLELLHDRSTLNPVFLHPSSHSPLVLRLVAD